MDYIELIEIFKKNLTQKNFLIDRLIYSKNPLHIKDVLAVSEMLNKANIVFHDLINQGEKSPALYHPMDQYTLKDQVYILSKSDNNIDKTIIYVFKAIKANSLTTEFNQCLGTLNAPSIFGEKSNLGLKGVFLNIFEIHNDSKFIFPSWCNVFLIDGLQSRAMPNISLNSIEDQLTNPIDFFPDAIATLNDLYDFKINNIDIEISDIFIKQQ